MAIVEQPRIELEAAPEDRQRHEPLGVFARPRTKTGWRSWVTTVDHKRIGIMYGVAAFVFFLIGGIEALLIRVQLASPEGTVLSADLYNQIFTMHGVTMVFLVIMPMANAFANYLVPLQIGARDVAFPRLNAFGLWCFLFGGIFFTASSLLTGEGPDGGWFAYVPNTDIVFSPSHGMDFYALGLQITGIASLTSAINLIVTIINMRAPGMTLMKMPVFTWMAFVTQFLLLFAIPVITVALFLLMFDRRFDTNFFNVDAGADPLLWQHLFWIFGHPEVYILILPSFGIVSEVIPIFSRKPIFGYPFMVFSGIAIGFMGWGVWAHHMFASGIGPLSVAAFSLSTMFIAVPTGVKILNWMATMYGGRLRFTSAMLFAIGLVGMFTIGGLSGVTHAVSPADTQQTDTYYIVAHFHYVLFGGALFGLFAGMYLWWPKAFGHFLDERLGKIHFWLFMVGFNLTFGPMHILGLQGMPRRQSTYPENYGFEFWNMASTIGAFLIAAGVLVFMGNVVASRRRARALPPPPPDPWDGRSLEWSIPSPPPEHNFDTIPVVEHFDPWWNRKYREDETGRIRRVPDADMLAQTGTATGVHLPSPSYWPFVLALGLPVIAWGIIYNLWLAAIGALIVVAAIYGWGLEPSVDEDESHETEPHHDTGAHHDAEPPAPPAGSEEAAPVG